MTCSSLMRSLASAMLAISVTLPAGAQSVVGRDRTGPAPNPVNLDTTGLFQAKFVSVGDDMFIGGQPTEKALRSLKAQGVTTLVNLRMPEEMAQIGFDEAALARTRDQVRPHPDARHGRESVRAKGARHLHGGDGGGGWQGAPALHNRVAGESLVGRVSDS